jgi:uncharacterized protein with PhoU and TrkA domain
MEMKMQKNEEMMRQLVKMASEQATELIASKAVEFAQFVPKDMPPKDVLEAFAKAIRETNRKTWGINRTEQ